MPVAQGSSLICRVADRFCALPVDPVAGAPAFVLGLAIVRGAPCPVVHACSLLGDADLAPSYLVSLRVADRKVALAVSACVGVRRLDPGRLADLPPLTSTAGGAVAALGVLDSQLLQVLDAAHLLAPEVLASLEGAAQ